MTGRWPTSLMTGVLLATGWMALVPDAQAETSKILVAAEPHEFSPQILTIRIGAKVIWINQGDDTHSLVSAGEASRHATEGHETLFINAALLPGSSYTHGFTVSGTYYYFCADHMQVWGVVVVEE